MRELGYDEITVDEYGSVIGIRRGAQPGKTILLDAHLDVVAVTNREEWTHDPFGGEISGGKIWGRGACDNKGVLATMICGVASIPRAVIAGTLVVSASVCEETLTGAALAPILDQYTPDVVIVGEPTELKLGIAQKGRAGLIIKTRGTSTHTSHPELGDNAVYKMLEIIQRLRALTLDSDPELGREILELTEIVSEPMPGAGFVPSGCRARFVHRTMPGQTPERILTRLRHAVAELDATIDFDYLSQQCYTGKTLEIVDCIPGWRAHLNDPWQSKILATLRDANLPAATFAAPFGTNASVSATRGIPSFIFGPGSIEQAHVVNEFIAVDALLAGERAFATIARACLNQTSH